MVKVQRQIGSAQGTPRRAMFRLLAFISRLLGHQGLWLRAAVLMCAANVACFGGFAAAEELRSGPQPGERVGEFQVYDCTGPAAGKTLCYACRYGPRPVIGVFVQTIDDQTAALIKQLDQLVDRHREQRLAAFVVTLADDPFTAARKLQDVAEQHAVQRVPLTVYRDTRQKLKDELRLAPTVGVTVVMWVDGEVRANHAFAATELDQPAIQRVLKSAGTILPNAAASE